MTDNVVGDRPTIKIGRAPVFLFILFSEQFWKKKISECRLFVIGDSNGIQVSGAAKSHTTYYVARNNKF